MDPADIVILRNEITEVLVLIERGIDSAKREAARMGIDVMDMRSPDGTWIMNSLLASKTKALFSRVTLELVAGPSEI